jgi:dipeptidyl-peptidase-4
MRRNLLSLSLLLIFSCLFSFAQDQKLTIEDASYMNRDLFPESIQNLAWRGDSDRLSYVKDNSLVSFRAKSTQRDTILTLDQLNAEFVLTGNDSLKRFPRITWEDVDVFSFSSNHAVYSYHLSESMIREENSYPEDAGNMDLHRESGKLAYTIDNNLYIAVDGKQEQLTNDEDRDIINGQTVHRNEFGISKGTFWSPDGSMLAFYRKDQTMVTDYPLLDIKQRIAATNLIKYPMAGMTSEEVTIGVYHLEEGKTVFLKTGEPKDQYLASVTWGPRNQYIYVAVLNRDQNHLQLKKYDGTTGDEVSVLFEEKSNKYVEPEHPLYFVKGAPDRFIWMSERDGFDHLYLYNTDGELLRQLTQGEWVVTEFLGMDEDGKEAFFLATGESPLNRDLYAVALKNGNVRRVFERTGTHNVIPSAEFEFFVDIFSDSVTTRDYSVMTGKGKELQSLLKSVNPLEGYKKAGMKIFTLQAEDGAELYCRMLLPPGFDPGQKYPAIVYVYGGPHAQLVRNSWMGGASFFLHYLAQEGYVVFTLDNRGSANRGRDFEQALFRNMGTIEVEDQMVGVNYLKEQPFINAERIGVHGWSYGGFMTISLMVKKPGQFSVGVCGGPVTDWKYYEVMYGERYMDTPQSNPEGYEASSLLGMAGNLEGDLLIIHGTDDPVVVWQHTLSLLEQFIKEGKLVDYFVYPGHGHGVGGRDRVHLNRKMAKYFFDNL